MQSLGELKDVRFNNQLRVEVIGNKKIYYPLAKGLNDSLQALSLLVNDQRCAGEVVSSKMQFGFRSEYGHMQKVLPVRSFTLESGASVKLNL